MKRILLGAALFALVWALAFLTPTVREIPRAMPLLVHPNAPEFAYDPKPKHLAPDNPVAVEWKLENWGIEDVRERIRNHAQFDALAARFPNELWIPAARLRQSTLFLLNVSAAKITPPLSPENALLVDDWKRAVQIAATCEKREPNNPFWPWMGAVFSFALGHKSQGLAAMERAGNAPHYNDYIQSTIRARLALWQQHGDPIWEEKIIGAFSSFNMNALGIMEKTCEVSMNEALLARRRGDNAYALRLSAAILRVNQVLRRDSNQITGGYEAEFTSRRALEQLFAGQLPYKRSEMETYEDQAQHLRALRDEWATLARVNGRSDLAKSADWLLEPSVSLLNRSDGEPDYWGSWGFPVYGPSSLLAANAPLFLVVFGSWCFVIAFLWALGSLLLRRSNVNSPTRGQVAQCANFGFWALLGLFVMGIKTGWLTKAIPPFIYWDKSFIVTHFLWSGAFILGCWLVPVLFITWKGERRFVWSRSEQGTKERSRTARLASWIISGVSFGALLLLANTFFRHIAILGVMLLCVSFSSLLCALALEIARLNRVLPLPRLKGEEPSNNTPLPLKYARLGACVTVFLCLFLVGSGMINLSDWPSFYSAFTVALGVGAFVLALLLNRKVKRSDGFTFRLATRTAGVLALAWSVVFLFASLAAWPLRAELNRQLDRRLSMREVDWMKEQIAKYPPENSGR